MVLTLLLVADLNELRSLRRSFNAACERKAREINEVDLTCEKPQDKVKILQVRQIH